MAGQRCSSSAFQRFSVPAAAAAVRAWAASASQQFGVSGFERCRCPGVSACPASASQQFRVSEFQRLSVPAAAAAVRGRAALQQFRVSEFKLSSCCGGGAWLGSVAAVLSFRASAFPLRRPRCVPGQRQRRSSPVFQRFSVAAALLAVPAQRQHRRSSSEFQSFSV